MISKKTLATLAVYTFLILATIVLLYPVISREGSFCVNPDNRNQAFPFLSKLASSLWKGYIPVWDANTYCGKNFAGEFQSGIFYPLNLLWCWLFGSARGIDVYYMDLLVVLHYFIGLTGMYALARSFKFSQPAAVATALIYAFTGAMGSRANGQTCIFFGLALFPWVLFCLSKYYLGLRKKKYLIFTGIVCGLQILSGHIQPFFHAMIACLIMTACFEYANRQSNWLFLKTVVVNMSIILGCAVILSLPQLYYAVQYLAHAYRWVDAEQPIKLGQRVPLSVFAHKHMLAPGNLFNIINKHLATPDDGNLIYMGVLPCFIFIIYLIKGKAVQLVEEHVYLKKVLAITLVVSILSIIGYLTFFSLVLYFLPLVSSVRELGRYVILFNTSAALIVGLFLTYAPAFKEQLFGNAKRKWQLALLVLIVNALYLVFTQQKEIPLFIGIPFLLAFIYFIGLLNIRNTALVSLFAIAVIFVELCLNRVDYGAVKSDKYAATFYERNRMIDFLEKSYGKYRVALDVQNDDLQRKNLGNVYNIQTKMGYCATMNDRFFDFISNNWDQNSEGYDLLNIRYIVSDKLLDSNFVLLDSIQPLYLYERKNYYPRSYWKTQLGKPGKVIEQENETTIRQTAYSDIYQKIEVDCKAADTLIVSENYYPGWKCYDNNNKIPVFLAPIPNQPPLFRAIALDKGHHVIEFKYNKAFYWF